MNEHSTPPSKPNSSSHPAPARRVPLRKPSEQATQAPTRRTQAKNEKEILFSAAEHSSQIPEISFAAPKTPAGKRLPNTAPRRSGINKTATNQYAPQVKPLCSLPITSYTTRPKKKKKPLSGKRIFGRVLLVIGTLLLLTVIFLLAVCLMIFRGPSESACEVLTMSMVESSGMKWVPGLFIGQERVDEIRSRNETLSDPGEAQSDPTLVIIQSGGLSGTTTVESTSGSGEGDLWAGHSDGIRIDKISGEHYNAYVMLIRDPSRVYTAVSNKSFSKSVPGTRINKQILTEGAIAAINGGAFFDNGTTSITVGSVPCGLVYSKGEMVWNDGDSYDGFVGFTEDNILVVAHTISAAKAKELKIRDGCCFGPVLIMNGKVNEKAYNQSSGMNPRTAIAQRSDGTVIFLCVDGRQAGSLGATYADITDILVEYGAVNACNLDGGSSTVMLYKDTDGLYGEKGNIQMINNYSLLQEEPRRMPTFFMVKGGK